jgi:hypothetical protein
MNFPVSQQVVLLSSRVGTNITAVGQFDSMKSLVNEQFRLNQEPGRTVGAEMENFGRIQVIAPTVRVLIVSAE